MENNNLEFIYGILNEVLPNKVYYALSIEEQLELPIIVYQELNKRNRLFSDDKYLLKESTMQINLITENKDIELERSLEDTLTNYDVEFNMVSEFYLKDSGLYRIYEVKMEETRYEQ